MNKVKHDLSSFLTGNEKGKTNHYTNLLSTSVVTYDLELPNNNKEEIFVVKRYDFNEIKTFLVAWFHVHLYPSLIQLCTQLLLIQPVRS